MPACSHCPQEAVAFQRHAGTHLCREHFLLHFRRTAKQEVARQGRLPEGRVAVALSGGKDSVAALHFLHGLAAANPRVELVAITVDEGIAGYRDSALAIAREVTGRLGVAWHVVRTQELAGYSIDAYASGAAGPPGREGAGQARPACGPCGVFRRAGMNRLARELGCRAVVTGHNLDDQAQTVLMNHLKGDLDRLARLAPHTQEDWGRHGGLVPRILPFRTLPEKEVLLYALLEGLPIHDEAECPYAARSHRFALRDVLVGLEEANPGTRHALVRGHERLKPILQAALPPVAMATCACGEPTSGTRCIACSLRSPAASAP